jgi:hypothetical protein
LPETQRPILAFNVNEIRATDFDMSFTFIRRFCPNDIPVYRARRDNNQPNFPFIWIVQNDIPFVLQEREFRIDPVNVLSYISRRKRNVASNVDTILTEQFDSFFFIHSVCPFLKKILK